MRVSRCAVRLHGLEIAEHGRDTARREDVGSLRRAYERCDLMIRTQSRIEHRGADVSCRAREEDAHEGPYIIIQSMRRDTLIDFFGDIATGRGDQRSRRDREDLLHPGLR